MSITFPTTNLKVPSGITALPSGVKRPGFGTLYGFDAQGGGGAVVFSVEIQDTEANILARSSDDAGTIAYGTDTENYYIFDGSLWFNYPEQQ